MLKQLRLFLHALVLQTMHSTCVTKLCNLVNAILNWSFQVLNICDQSLEIMHFVKMTLRIKM